MSVTAASLKIRFPEFVDAEDALVTASITDAALMVDSSFYGAKADMAITWLAAHYVAVNPMGELARLVKDDGTTTYLLGFNQVQKSIGAGCRVI